MGLAALFGRKVEPVPGPDERSPDEPRRVVPALPGLKVPSLHDDPQFAKAVDSAQRIAAKLAEWAAKRDDLKAASLTGDDLAKLVSGDGDALMGALESDSATVEEAARLDREIANLERAAKFAGEHLAEVKHRAAWRVGQQFSATLAPLRVDAIAKLTAAHGALEVLFAACSRGEDAELSGCGPGVPPAASGLLFEFVASLKEYAGGMAVQSPAPEAGR